MLSIHSVGAALLKTPELKLDEAEAKELAANSANVAQHYGIAPSEKTQAWTGLITCLAMIYYPRFYLMAERRKEEKASAAQRKAGIVMGAQQGI